MADKGLDVLDKYDFEVKQTSRGRGVIVVSTDKGLKLLKEYTGSGKYIEWTAGLLEAVNHSGLIAVDAYVRNKDGEYISTSADGNRYVVKEWYECRDCDVKIYGDIILVVRVLAVLHNELEKYDTGEIKYKGRPLKEEMRRHISEILRVKKYLTRRNNRNDFEILATSWCDTFYEEGQKTLEEFERLKIDDSAASGICHGNYNYHNICLGAHTPVIINFEKMHHDYLMCDLYNIMRKIMEKYDWDVKLAYKFMTEYDKIRPLKESDLNLLGIMFSFPEKFWKIINAYNNSRKAWIPAKNLEKLRKVIAQNDKRLEFIRTIH